MMIYAHCFPLKRQEGIQEKRVLKYYYPVGKGDCLKNQSTKRTFFTCENWAIEKVTFVPSIVLQVSNAYKEDVKFGRKSFLS